MDATEPHGHTKHVMEEAIRGVWPVFAPFSARGRETARATVLAFVFPLLMGLPALAQEQGGTSSSGLATSEPIQVLTAPKNLDPWKVSLGRRLFNDRRLSRDDTVACVSCHNLAHGGANRTAVSVGIGGHKGDLNAPTVFNAGLNVAQFWNGRAETLEDQIDGPVHHAAEMDSDWDDIIGKLEQDESYKQHFEKLYEDGITAANIKNAIADFERSLITEGSRFDRYLMGDLEALSESEIEGYQLFKDLGCASCHQGANVGGNLFVKFGVWDNYFEDRGSHTDADLGRYNVTGRDRDRHVFKVPSLRAAAATPPYFHDGSEETLEGAIFIMAFYQLGVSLKPDKVERLADFIRSLAGNIEGKPIWP